MSGDERAGIRAAARRPPTTTVGIRRFAAEIIPVSLGQYFNFIDDLWIFGASITRFGCVDFKVVEFARPQIQLPLPGSRRSGERSRPSMAGSSGNPAPPSDAKVGSRSIIVVNAAQVVPDGIVPGQRARQGMRMPPSRVDPFPPLSGALLPPCLGLQPLSEVKTTSVSSSIPRSASVSRITPVVASRCATAAP